MELLASNCKTAVWKEERQLGWVHFQELCSSVSGGEDHPPDINLPSFMYSQYHPLCQFLTSAQGHQIKYWSFLFYTKILLHVISLFCWRLSFSTSLFAHLSKLSKKPFEAERILLPFCGWWGKWALATRKENKTDTELVLLCKMLGGISRLQMDISWWWNIFNRGLKHQGSHCCGWESRHTVN